MTAPAGMGMADAPIRVGVIGAGLSGSIHLAALRHAPDLVAISICTRRPERAAAIALELQLPSHTSDYRVLCRDPEVEAVIIAAPPHLHHAMVIAALEAGKHVLCEKPMARNLAEARDMQRIANQAGSIAMINQQQRFLPIRRRIKKLIGEGFIGDPEAATVSIHRSSLNDPQDRPWGWLMEQDKGGGMLGATGAHYLDALRWWFGEVKSAAGAVATMVKQRRLPDSSGMGKVDADDNFAVLLRFANGALGTIHVTATAGFEGDEDLTLSGSRGILMVRGGVLFGARSGDREIHEIPVLESDPVDLPVFDHFLVEPTLLLHREWAEAIRTGEPGAPSFADGVKVQELLDAVVRSSQQGRWIDTSGQRWPTGGMS